MGHSADEHAFARRGVRAYECEVRHVNVSVCVRACQGGNVATSNLAGEATFLKGSANFSITF